MVYHPKSPHCCTQTSSIFPSFLGNLHGYNLDRSSLKQASHLHSLHTFIYQATWKYEILSTAGVFRVCKSLMQSPDHNYSFLCDSLHLGRVKKREDYSEVLSLPFSFWPQRNNSRSKHLLPPSTEQWEG